MYAVRAAIFAAILAIALPVTSVSTASAPSMVWRTNFMDAWAEAKRLDKPMVLHFYADWCGPCLQMDRDVLKKGELLERLGTGFVAVKIDADEDRELASRFHVRALPTDVFVDPDGTVLGQNEGYQDLNDYLTRLGRAEAKFVQSRRLRIVADRHENEKKAQAGEKPGTTENQTSAAGRSNLLAVTPKDNSRLDSPGGSVVSRIGLDGYSPVAISEWRKWRKGRKEYAATYQDMIYYLATAEELREFQLNPARYAPRLLGCDPVVLWQTDRAAPGSTQYGAYFDGDLYLFVTPDSREQFKANPLRYTRFRHVLRTDSTGETRRR